MDIVASTSSPSLTQFEDFIKQNPTAENIVVSGGHIVASSSGADEDQAKTEEAFKQALKAKYPEQENLVDEAFDSLQASGKSWDAHTICQIIKEAEKNASEIDATWKDVEDEGASQEDIAKVTEAFDQYVQQVIGGFSPEDRTSLQQQFAAAGLDTAGVGMAVLATHVPTHAANAALANLLTTISASLSSGGTTLPMMGSAAPAGLATAALPTSHLVAASAMMGTTAAVTSASVQVTVASAASAIVPFIIAGAIAHRLYVATSRIARASSSFEHEVNNISTAMIAAALTAIPPAQHALLLSTIVGGIVGQHMVDPGVMQQAFHNIRDAALGVYLVEHPDVAIALGYELQTLMLSAFKALAPVAGLTTASTTTTGAATAASTAAVATTTAATAAATTSATAGTVTQAAPTAALHHSIAATAAHGLSTATTVVAATIAAHPGVTAAILVGGACAAAYRCAKSSPSPVVQN
ncbi:MAG: hypothetical protein K2W97_00835 [Chthoniobacterales bacterium]|nr:hypothetical protein [Chthoniobacterales bacterium]